MSRLRRDINIGPRLTIAFLAVAFLAFASGLIGLVGFQRASAAASILVQDADMIEGVQEIRVAIGPLLDPPGDFVLTGDVTARDRFVAAMNNIQNRLAAYDALHGTHQHTVPHGVSAQDLIDFAALDLEKIALLEKPIFEAESLEAGAAHLVELDALAATLSGHLNELLKLAQEDITSATANHAAAERSAFIGLTSSAILAIGLALGLGLTFTRLISVPLGQLADAADRIAAGDLATPVNVAASGEIGLLSDVFERMRQALVKERGQLRLLAVLEERDRIGREMHDGLAQVLGYVNTKAQAVGEFLRSGEPNVAEQQIEELVSAAQEAYTDAREVIVGLRVDGAGERGLSETLSEYVEQFVRRNDIRAALHLDSSWDDAILSPKAQVQLLRIVQESLTNVRKHAQATCVEIALIQEQHEAVIRVSDDGVGFNLSRLLRPDYSRYGLRTMRERTQAIGGRFRVESSPGKGTAIIVRVPISQAEEEKTL